MLAVTKEAETIDVAWKWPDWLKAGWLSCYDVCGLTLWTAHGEEPRFNDITERWDSRGHMMVVSPTLCDFVPPDVAVPCLIRNPKYKQ